MSSIGKTIIKKVAGKEIICRELSVGEIRQLFSRPGATDLVDALFEDIPLGDLPVFTSLAQDDVEAMQPSDLRLVVDGCREANPDFFDMLVRVGNARNLP